MNYSNYVLDLDICDKSDNLLFKIYDKTCLVLLDETILQLLKKITFVYNKKYPKNKLSHSSIYIYNKKNYNIISKTNLTSSNILKEIIEENIFNSNGLNTDRMLIDYFGNITHLKLNILILTEEMENIIKFFSSNLTSKTSVMIFKRYITFYFPLLDFEIFTNIIKNMSSENYIESFNYIERDQYEILELDVIDKTDSNYFDDPNLSALFLEIYPEFKCSLDFDMLKNNIVFLNDMFLTIFDQIKISSTILSCVLQSPQITIQKGSVDKEVKKTNDYRLILKGLMQNLKFTFELYIKRCKIFINFINYKTTTIKENTIQLLIEDILKYLKNDFVEIGYSTFNIDFFNTKVGLTREIELNNIAEKVKLFEKYFTLYKVSQNSITIKYKMGRAKNIKYLIYNKISSILKSGSITNELFRSLSDEFGLDDEELYEIIYELKNNINDIYKDKGISILITNSNIQISGVNTIEINTRLYYLLGRLFNISLKELNLKEKVIRRVKNDDKYSEYVTLLDKYLKRKSTDSKNVYWCKACQNYGNKIRKPIMYDHVPEDFKYDKETQTFINDFGYRLLEISPGVYFGCNSKKSNPNKYIGFVKTCSLCCFKYDQFLDIKVTSSKKVNTCWYKTKMTSKDISGSYIYSYSRIVGDISRMLIEFDPYFSDSNYLCTLEYIGEQNKLPTINELIFIDTILINPQMYDGINEYKIYIYQHPFLHKVIYNNENKISETFLTTPIAKYIDNSKSIFNTIIPTNAYNIYFQYKNLIKSFSFVKNNLIVIFIFTNNIVLYVYDRSLKFGTYETMFGDLKYVNKFDIPSFKSIEDVIKTKQNMTPVSILINSNNNVLGIVYSHNIYLIFQEISESEFDKKGIFKKLERKINIEIINYISKSIKNISSNSLISQDIYNNYLYSLFRYNIFIFLNQNNKIKMELFKLIEANPNIQIRHTVVKTYIFNLFNDLTNNTFIKLIDKLDYNFNLDNDIINLYSKCEAPFVKNKECQLSLTKDLLDKFLVFVINEIIYKHASIYKYVSKYIDNIFSYSNNYIKLTEYNYSIDSKQTIGKIIGDQFIQEIYNLDMPIYRALSNIYFWSKMKQEKNFQKRNLGYLSKSQTSLSYYLKSIILSDSNPINIIKYFNEYMNLNINLIFDNLTDQKIDQYNIYVNIKNNIIKNISVGFLV